MNPPDPSRTEASPPPTRSSILRALGLAFIGWLIAAMLLSSLGGAASPVDEVATTLRRLLPALAVSVLLQASAIGLGRPLRSALFPKADDRLALQWAAGLAFLFVIVQVVGTLGFLVTPIALGITAIGLALLATDLDLIKNFTSTLRTIRTGGAVGRISAVLIALTSVLAAVAATRAPGALWSSEFSGYDALSYHLPLAQGWFSSGRIEPLDHAVYSYLPSGMETLFAWIAAVSLADPQSGSLLAGGAWRLFACQIFHASFIAIAGLMTARATLAAVRRLKIEVPPQTERAGLWAVAAGVCSVPWLVVTGTLAYNDTAAAAFGAMALLASLSGEISVSRRAFLVAVLMAGATLCKPTALLLLTPMISIALIWAVLADRSGRKAIVVPIIRVISIAAIIGLLCISPWLIRNAVASGNPVFPFASDILGTGNWTDEQIEIWNENHHFTGGLFDAMRLAVWTDPNANSSARAVERFRGLTNPQWLLFWPAVLASIIGLFLQHRTRPIAILLAIGTAAGLVVWLSLTHIQARFLIPLAPIGAVAIGIAALSGRSWVRAALVIIATIHGGAIFSALQREYTGDRNARFRENPGIWMGEIYTPAVRDALPFAYLNNETDPDARILSLGAATPLYSRHHASGNLVWSTVWDRGPLLEAVTENPDSPPAWAEALSSVGADYLFVDITELARFERNGYLGPGFDLDRLMRWIASLGQPEFIWQTPNGAPRAALIPINQRR